MKYTSAEANKLLRTIEGKISDITRKEAIASSFQVASGEDIESLRPKYDFAGTQAEIDGLKAQLRMVKHAINCFNLTHSLPGFEGLTIDQALVYIPQMTEKVRKLRGMSEVLPKQRVTDCYNASFVDYKVANYNIEEAEKAYAEAKKTLAALQLALDSVNNTETMEIDITPED